MSPTQQTLKTSEGHSLVGVPMSSLLCETCLPQEEQSTRFETRL